MIPIFIKKDDIVNEKIFNDDMFNIIVYSKDIEIKKYLRFNSEKENLMLYIIKLGSKYHLKLCILNYDKYIVFNPIIHDIDYFARSFVCNIDLHKKHDRTIKRKTGIFNNENEDDITTELIDNIENYKMNYIVIKNGYTYVYKLYCNNSIIINNNEINKVDDDNIDFGVKNLVFKVKEDNKYYYNIVSSNNDTIYMNIKSSTNEVYFEFALQSSKRNNGMTSYYFIEEEDKYRIYVKIKGKFIKGKLMNNLIKNNIISDLDKYL